jgi:hypothetical protein
MISTFLPGEIGLLRRLRAWQASPLSAAHGGQQGDELVDTDFRHSNLLGVFG